MKIIDLINKIANGKKVPKRIKYDTKEMKYDHNKQDYLGYLSNGNGEWLFQYLFDRCRNTEYFINDEVEIIEEIKEIEKLGESYRTFNGNFREFKKLDEYGGKVLANKIDEIIDKVNELDKEK